jgi:hypothetical protein
MDDTQSTPGPDRFLQDVTPNDDPVATLAGMDPAEAPPAAERYAAALEADLESAGVQPREPEQMQVDLGAGTET